MNWMGGARSRIKQHGDKKIQKQFFERKRLMKRNEYYANIKNGLKTPLDRKSAVSQDMKSFCLLEQMHSKEMLCQYDDLRCTIFTEPKRRTPKENLRPVKKLVLDKPNSSRLLHHSTLGSSPPFNTPSKLLFMEPKYQRDTSAKKVLSERGNLDSKQLSSNSKAQNEWDRKNSFTNRSTTSSDTYGNFTSYKGNPFISEDFQPTPIVKYLKTEESPDSGEQYQRWNNVSELSPLTPAHHQPESMSLNDSMHKKEVQGESRDFYEQNFSRNPFFETPVEHNLSKKRKLENDCVRKDFPRNFHHPSKRSLFEDTRFLAEIEKVPNDFNRSNSCVHERSKVSDCPGSDFMLNRNHIRKEAPSTPSEPVYKRACDDLTHLDPQYEISLKSHVERKMQTFQDFHSKIAPDRYMHVFSTSKNLGALTVKNEQSLNSKVCLEKRDTAASKRGGKPQSFDDSFEIMNKHSILDRDEMSLLITSTPLDIARKHMKLESSPMGNPLASEISPIGKHVEMDFSPRGKPMNSTEKKLQRGVKSPMENLWNVIDSPMENLRNLIDSPMGKPVMVAGLSRINVDISKKPSKPTSLPGEMSPNCVPQVLNNTMVLNESTIEDTENRSQSVSTDHQTDPSDTELAEVLAEISRLEGDQVKEWELSVYCSQTCNEEDDEEQYILMKKLNDISDSFESIMQENDKAIKLEKFIENKYDALSMLKAVAVKLEKYIEEFSLKENKRDLAVEPSEESQFKDERVLMAATVCGAGVQNAGLCRITKNLTPERPVEQELANKILDVHKSDNERLEVKESANERHVAQKSTNENTVIQKLTSENIVIQKSANERPVVQKSANERPLVQKSANEKPLLQKSANEKPLVQETVNERGTCSVYVSFNPANKDFEGSSSSNHSDTRETDVTLTASQISNGMKSAHQMSTARTNDMKCKCRDSFVLRSSRETQTEIATRSTGAETERINVASVGVQCNLLLDGCDCELEAPGSQDSFHSVTSNFDPEISLANLKKEENEGYLLRSRKKL